MECSDFRCMLSIVSVAGMRELYRMVLTGAFSLHVRCS